MRNPLAWLACAIVATAAAIGWVYLKSPMDGATNPPQPPAQNRSTQVLTLRAEPPIAKNGRESTSTPARSNKLPYEEFKAGKLCLDNSGTPGAISKDIADLKAAVAAAAADAKVALENEIRRKQAQLDVLANCGSEPVTRRELSKLLEQAARQGDHAAQLEYALDPMIDRNRSIENLDRLRAWRETALKYVQSAVDRGDPQAAVDLAGAYDPLQCQPANKPSCSDMLPLIVAPDAATAYRYYVQSTLSGSAPPWVEAERATLEQFLSADQIAGAQQDAKRALAERAAEPASP